MAEIGIEQHELRKGAPDDNSHLRVVTDSLTRYLNEMGQTKLLTADQERQLAQIIERGREAEASLKPESSIPGHVLEAINEGKAAKEHFIKANLRLVVAVANKYPLPPGMDRLDLIQEGNLGLEHAVDKFDWRKGFKFSTYATFWIRQAIGRALDGKSTLVVIPTNRVSSLRSTMRAASGEGLDTLGEEDEQLLRIMSPVSLNAKLGDEEDSEFVDIIPDNEIGPEDTVVESESQEAVRRLMDKLEDLRDREVLKMRHGFYGQVLPYRKIGEKYGITGEAARRICERAERRFRKILEQQEDLIF